MTQEWDRLAALKSKDINMALENAASEQEDGIRAINDQIKPQIYKLIAR